MKAKVLINLLMLGYVSFIHADNVSLFNQAQQAGDGHQFKLNLNPNSNITSYGNSNGFESIVANNASAGNANAQNLYGSANLDPNYLFNSGTQDIINCETQSDPRCTTINKYLDKGTQATLQAYSQGVSERFYISVKPDSANSSCSMVTRKVPVNPTTITCNSGLNQQATCTSIIVPGLTSYQCDPTVGGCAQYQSDPDCTQTQPYQPGSCLGYSYQYNSGGDCHVLTGQCSTGSSFRTDGCQGSGGRPYSCGECSSGGDPGDHNACWNQQCTNLSPPQLAVYACKTYTYNDQCARFKQ